MCIDFTNLYKAYTKDSYPLPRIDQLMYATARYELLSFINAFFKYNQIHMVSKDKEKKALLLTMDYFVIG